MSERIASDANRPMSLPTFTVPQPAPKVRKFWRRSMAEVLRPLLPLPPPTLVPVPPHGMVGQLVLGEPGHTLDAWLDRFRRFWTPHLEALATELARGRRERRLGGPAPPNERGTTP